MVHSQHIKIFIVLTALFFAYGNVVQGAPPSPSENPGWDSAVNSLLAAGMYGFALPQENGLQIQLQHTEDLYKGLTADKKQLNGQAITFSYEGSSGLLGFSAGYIYTSQANNKMPGKVFLGIDPVENTTFDPTRSWYMAFDLAKSYEINEDLTFGLGSKAMLMKNPFDTKEGKLFSMLFNMPVSYKNYITITPEFQWSRPVPDANLSTSSAPTTTALEKGDTNEFYGGVSISFSY